MRRTWDNEVFTLHSRPVPDFKFAFQVGLDAITVTLRTHSLQRDDINEDIYLSEQATNKAYNECKLARHTSAWWISVDLCSRHSECIDQPLEIQMRLRCQRLELKSAGHGHQGGLKAVGHHDFPAHPTLAHQARRIDESSPSVVFRSFICLANFYYLSDSPCPSSAVSKENFILRPCR